MLTYVKSWYKRYFSDPEATMLAIFLVLAIGFIYISSDLLAPVFAALIIAYLLQSGVNFLNRLGLAHIYSSFIVFTAFLGLFLVCLLILLPMIWNQFLSLFEELPKMVGKLEALLITLQARFPEYISKDNIELIVELSMDGIKTHGKELLAVSLASIPNIIKYLVYIVLIPLIVFFMLKDSVVLLKFSKRFLPKKRKTLAKIWCEVDMQIGNYIRGKFVEFLIMTIATAILLLYFDLPYVVLLSLLVGASVLVPYLGAVVCTIPTVSVGAYYLGMDTEFYYFLTYYTITQLMDANILVPILFSNAVSIHPLAIIVSVLFFGGMFGIWGVFFAIPLAVFVKAVISAWPISSNKE